MLNGRTICVGILCVLSVTSTIFAQSQTATDTITEKIYQSEGKVREHVDKKVEGIETKISAVDTKVETVRTKIGTLSTDVAVNKTNIANMQDNIRDLKGAVDRIWYGILGVLGTLILSIAGYFFKSWREGRGKVDNVEVVDRLTEQIINLTSAQVENSAQITRLISAQAETSATRGVPGDPEVPRMERLDKLTDDRSSQQRDVKGTV